MINKVIEKMIREHDEFGEMDVDKYKGRTKGEITYEAALNSNERVRYARILNDIIEQCNLAEEFKPELEEMSEHQKGQYLIIEFIGSIIEKSLNE